jgi:hypothetical protein
MNSFVQVDDQVKGGHQGDTAKAALWFIIAHQPGFGQERPDNLRKRLELLQVAAIRCNWLQVRAMGLTV